MHCGAKLEGHVKCNIVLLEIKVKVIVKLKVKIKVKVKSAKLKIYNKDFFLKGGVAIVVGR